MCQEFRAAAVGLKTVVADADEAPRQDMKKGTMDEMGSVEGQEAAPIATSAIAIGKGDLPVRERDQTFIANGDPVGITAEIAKHLCGTGHGWLAVDDPFSSESLAKQPAPRRGSGTEILRQVVKKLSTEDPR